MLHRCQDQLALYKADIDSAFRRVPIAPAERDLAYVAFAAHGKLQLFGRNAMPFGAIASVHAWDRIGAWPLGTGAVVLH